MIDRHALDHLIEDAAKSRDQAGRELAEQHRTERQLQDQIATLNTYHSEYRQRLQRAMADGVSLNTIRDYQQFLRSLDDAIKQTETQLTQQRRSVVHSRKNLADRQGKLSSFDTLAERRKHQERSRQARVEQKQSDEFINNAYARKSAANHAESLAQEDL